MADTRIGVTKMWCRSSTVTGYKNLGDDGPLMWLSSHGKMEPAWQEAGALYTMMRLSGADEV